MANLNHLSQLKWSCRRGMLELDVLLTNFLTDCYASLSKEDQLTFIDLIKSADPDLYAWLLGQTTSNNPHFQRLINKIIHHARSRVRT